MTGTASCYALLLTIREKGPLSHDPLAGKGKADYIELSRKDQCYMGLYTVNAITILMTPWL